MKDTLVTGTLAGIVGAIVLDVVTYLALVIGIKTSTPWDVAALVFLRPQYLGTISGYIIGIIGSLALGIAAGIMTSMVIKITGSDYAWLKGVIVAEAVGFATLGFFAPLVKIAGFLKNQPVTNIFAMVNLFIFGLVTGYFIKRYGKFAGTNIQRG